MVMTESLDSVHQVATRPRKAKDALYPARLRAISVEVYLRIMEREYPGAYERTKANVPALTLNGRAAMYDKVVREVADIFGVEI